MLIFSLDPQKFPSSNVFRQGSIGNWSKSRPYSWFGSLVVFVIFQAQSPPAPGPTPSLNTSFTWNRQNPESPYCEVLHDNSGKLGCLVAHIQDPTYPIVHFTLHLKGCLNFNGDFIVKCYTMRPNKK